MLGLEITVGNEVTRVDVTNGESWFLVHYMQREGALSAMGRRNVVSGTTDKWWNRLKLTLGDKIKIRFTEIDDETPPLATEKSCGRNPPKSKLEQFHELEKFLELEGIDVTSL